MDLAAPARGAGATVRIRPSTTSAARGESHAAPLAAAWIATTRLSIGVSLARKPTRAGLQDRRDVAVLGGHGERQHACMSGSRSRIRRVASGPAEVGHAHVHEHHVGAKLGGQADAHLAARRLADDLDAVLGREQRGETRAEEVVVIDHEQSHHRVPRSTLALQSRTLRPSRSLCHPGSGTLPEPGISAGCRGGEPAVQLTYTKVQGILARFPWCRRVREPFNWMNVSWAPRPIPASHAA